MGFKPFCHDRNGLAEQIGARVPSEPDVFPVSLNGDYVAQVDKEDLPLTLMATREHCDFASACNPIKVLIALALGSPVSRVMAKAAHECRDTRSTREPPSGLETTCPAGLIFRVFIGASIVTRAAVPCKPSAAPRSFEVALKSRPSSAYKLIGMNTRISYSAAEPMQSAPLIFARRPQGVQPAHDVSDPHVPHLRILSILC